MTLTVYLIQRSPFPRAGSAYLPYAYLNEDVAKLHCEDLYEEWADYTPRKFEGEALDHMGHRVIVRVDNEMECVFALRLETAEGTHYARALRKLKKAEKDAIEHRHHITLTPQSSTVLS